MTLFHDTARAFSNCGTRVIAARDCVEVRLKPDTTRTRTIITARFIVPSDLRNPPAPPDLPDLPFQSEELRRVLPADAFALFVGDRQLGNRLQHHRDAAGLMLLFAASHALIGAPEFDRTL